LPCSLIRALEVSVSSAPPLRPSPQSRKDSFVTQFRGHAGPWARKGIAFIPQLTLAHTQTHTHTHTPTHPHKQTHTYQHTPQNPRTFVQQQSNTQFHFHGERGGQR